MFYTTDGTDHVRKIAQLEAQLKASKEDNMLLSRKNKELEQKNLEYELTIRKLQETLRCGWYIGSLRR